MRYLKLLFGIILLSSFGSAFAVADEYNPRQDVFDQVIYALVPTLIVYLFKPEEKDLYVKKLEDEEKQDVKEQENSTPSKSTKIRRVFDDFLCLLSLFILPTIVFHKNHEKFATPLWISILSGVAAGIVFIIGIIYYYISCCLEKDDKPNYIIYSVYHDNEPDPDDYRFYPFCLTAATVVDLCHIFSDICFLFYTRSLPMDIDFTDVFIYLHAVTGILGAIYIFVLMITSSTKIKKLTLEQLGDRKKELLTKIVDKFWYLSAKYLVPIVLIWTPVVQMLNMALLSGNDSYWTKIILALNLVYLSRVLYYAIEKNMTKSKEAETFGLLNMIFFIRYAVLHDI